MTTKRFHDKAYLERMSDKEIEEWKELKTQMQRIHNRTFLNLIYHYASYRNDREYELQRQHDRERHIAHMKSVPPGTEVLALQGENKGKIGTVVKHGRKYIHVDFHDKYDYWSMPYEWVSDKFDEKDIERRKRDKALEDKLTPLFDEFVSKV